MAAGAAAPAYGRPVGPPRGSSYQLWLGACRIWVGEAAGFGGQERKKVSMRKAMQLWPVRIGALALVGVVLYGAAYALLPRTVDHVSVTVLQCATVQATVVYDCPGTTLFHRTIA